MQQAGVFHAELGKAPAIADRLGELQEVRLVALTTGAFDLVADVFLPSVSDFLTFIQDELTRIPGIKGVATSAVLRQPKSRYNWTDMLSAAAARTIPPRTAGMGMSPRDPPAGATSTAFVFSRSAHAAGTAGFDA